MDKIHQSILHNTQKIFEDINNLPISDNKFTMYIGEYSQNKGTKDIKENRYICSIFLTW